MSIDDDIDDARPRQELLLALGRLVFEFGLLDETLHDALYTATGHRDETRILTSGLRFPQLVDRFEALYSGFQSDDGQIGVGQLSAYLHQLNSQRNREIHSVWGFWASTGGPARTQHRLTKGRMQFKIESVQPAVLEALADQMREAADKVWEVALDFERRHTGILRVSDTTDP